jgi:hypothetical protein
MKSKSLILFLFSACAVIFWAQGCDRCKEHGTLTLSETTQFFEATYLVDSNGANYTSIWHPDSVTVQLSTNGFEGSFDSISEDLSDGKIGPWAFTVTPHAAKMGSIYHYVYVVTKDRFGADTFEIKFYPSMDECHEYWGRLEYWKDGVLISTCDGKETCSIVIRE